MNDKKTMTLKDFCEQTGMGWLLPMPGSPEAETFLNRIFPDLPPVRYLREPLMQFAEQMELKLRKNDHKTSWRDLPVEALFRQLMLEIEEFKIADEFLSVEEARKELVDVSNYCLILHDRLGILPHQDRPRNAESNK